MSATLPERLELPIEGMTCASCATRIEKRLNKLDGVEATVNYATENAAVDFDPLRVAPEDLIAAIEAAGYHATLTEPEPAAAEDDPTAPLRRRLLVSALLSLPVLLLAMIEPLQFDNWQWLSLQLATPVVLWGGWPFHKAAWMNLKHGAATMDTLISVGTLAAWGWSVVALFFLDAGEPAHAHAVRARRRPRREREPDLSRGRLGRDRLHSGRPLLRGSRQAARRRGAEGTAGAGREGGERSRRAGSRAACRRRGPAGRRQVRRASRREAADGRCRRGGALGDRQVAADGGERAGRGRPGRRCDRGDGQRRRPAHRPRDQGRRGHCSRADRTARDRGAVRQGCRSAAGRSRLRSLRADRDRDRRCDARLLDRRRSGRRVRVLGGSRGSDHRLPLCTRAGDPDRSPRGHRPGRAARHPDQRAGGARVDSPGGHDPARQDGNGHDREDDARRRCSRPRRRPPSRRCTSSARSSTPPSIRSLARSLLRPRPKARLCRRRELQEQRGARRRRRCRRPRACSPAARHCSRSGGFSFPRR